MGSSAPALQNMPLVAELLSTLSFVAAIFSRFEDKLYSLMELYDRYVYSPINSACTPIAAAIPRTVAGVTVHTANTVTLTRTALCLPLAVCLRWGWPGWAALCIVWHDFLDHYDGTVARTQRRLGTAKDDSPLLGAFLDAFCDKVVNVFSLYAFLLLTPSDTLDTVTLLIVSAVCLFEVALAVVRTQDYYHMAYQPGGSQRMLKASMAGKLKEKLESMGIGFLCWAHPHGGLGGGVSGWLGLACLALSARLAYVSLTQKLQARTAAGGAAATTAGADAVIADGSDGDGDGNGHRANSTPKYDVVLSVGCYDVTHSGHTRLVQNMRRHGHKLCIGVHSSESIEKLKGRLPVDSLETRMQNLLEAGVDMVYPIAGTDPTPFLRGVTLNRTPTERYVYIRGDDMPAFPGREYIEEQHIDVILLPYTRGVSSSELRKKYNLSPGDDHPNFLERPLDAVPKPTKENKGLTKRSVASSSR